jgi:hypothetical protein
MLSLVALVYECEESLGRAGQRTRIDRSEERIERSLTLHCSLPPLVDGNT